MEVPFGSGFGYWGNAGFELQIFSIESFNPEAHEGTRCKSNELSLRVRRFNFSVFTLCGLDPIVLRAFGPELKIQHSRFSKTKE